ncbi:hypothetical protein PtA15_5A173 [Puccinia triticina]|uniref:Uncharacterized protein n=1 Tax=Puccinia triticina TaxID=208348 RepID=A0ABY7CIM1_9BASI|nr:uncharacterized protein PtA15_5A173 [Puccinia triticina]WAQ84600.1 hypothetical protein PtA15_5A173 [Puccinia triticina]
MNPATPRRVWSVTEIAWLLAQARQAAALGLESMLEAGKSKPEAEADEIVESPIRDSATEVQRSTGNQLSHAVVELTSTVRFYHLALIISILPSYK